MKDGSVECIFCGTEVADDLDFDRIPSHTISIESPITCPLAGMKWLEYKAILEKWVVTLRRKNK